MGKAHTNTDMMLTKQPVTCSSSPTKLINLHLPVHLDAIFIECFLYAQIQLEHYILLRFVHCFLYARTVSCGIYENTKATLILAHEVGAISYLYIYTDITLTYET